MLGNLNVEFEIFGEMNNSSIGSKPRSARRRFACAQRNACDSLSADSRHGILWMRAPARPE